MSLYNSFAYKKIYVCAVVAYFKIPETVNGFEKRKLLPLHILLRLILGSLRCVVPKHDFFRFLCIMNIIHGEKLQDFILGGILGTLFFLEFCNILQL